MTETTPQSSAQDDRTIILKQPIAGHSLIREIKLRYPTAREILEHGFPYAVQNTPDGQPIFIEDDAAIAFYAEACIEGDASEILTLLSMEDTFELRSRIIGFFIAAERRRRGSATQ